MISLIAIQLGCVSKKQQMMIDKTKGGAYVLSHGNIAITINPNLGARVTSAKLDNAEILLQERDDLVNWGATFWPAPQSRWNWPPPAAIHTGKYVSKIQGEKLIMESESDTTFGLRAIKTFAFGSEENSVSIAYQIFNDSDSAQKVGPWEISCVPAGGIVFFPLGTIPENTQSNMTMENVDGIGWFRFEADKLQPWQKIFNNASEGWLAHVTKGGVLFIKSFDKVASGNIAPGQGNVEVYVSKEFHYMELENHGKYTLLQPGDSLSYQVKWFITQLPENVSGESFNKELVVLVRTTIR